MAVLSVGGGVPAALARDSFEAHEPATGPRSDRRQAALEGLPAQGARASHLNHHLQARLPPGEGQQRGELGSGKHLTLQQPQQNRGLTLEISTELGHHPVHLPYGGAAADALVTQMGGANAVKLKQISLGIAETAR